MGGAPTGRRRADSSARGAECDGVRGVARGPTDDDALRLNVTTVFVAAAVTSAKW